MKRKNKEEQQSDDDEAQNQKKSKVEGEKTMIFFRFLNIQKKYFLDEEQEDDGEMDVDDDQIQELDFDVKSFRQSLRSDKYYDGDYLKIRNLQNSCINLSLLSITF